MKNAQFLQNSHSYKNNAKAIFLEISPCETEKKAESYFCCLQKNFFDASLSKLVLIYHHQNLLPAASIKVDMNHLLLYIQLGVSLAAYLCISSLLSAPGMVKLSSWP